MHAVLINCTEISTGTRYTLQLKCKIAYSPGYKKNHCTHEIGNATMLFIAPKCALRGSANDFIPYRTLLPCSVISQTSVQHGSFQLHICPSNRMFGILSQLQSVFNLYAKPAKPGYAWDLWYEKAGEPHMETYFAIAVVITLTVLI